MLSLAFIVLLVSVVLQSSFVDNWASLSIKETMEYVSAIGDPGMRSYSVRVAMEAWNFCNEVGAEAPDMVSPRWADCADLYCAFISGNSLRIVVFESGNNMISFSARHLFDKMFLRRHSWFLESVS